MLDLSGTGLFLRTRRFVPVGTLIHLEFELPSGMVQAVGEVRWVDGASGGRGEGLGIRFLRLSAASARAIDEAIALHDL